MNGLDKSSAMKGMTEEVEVNSGDHHQLLPEIHHIKLNCRVEWIEHGRQGCHFIQVIHDHQWKVIDK